MSRKSNHYSLLTAATTAVTSTVCSSRCRCWQMPMLADADAGRCRCWQMPMLADADAGSCRCHEPSFLIPILHKKFAVSLWKRRTKTLYYFFYLTECTSVIQSGSCFFISVSCRAFWMRFMPSLHGHALGQITRLIHVTAAQNSHIIGEQL